MRKNPYEGMNFEEMTLRDHLALDRTRLAAERTLLAYLRTALTLIIAGVTVNKFFPELYYQITAWLFIFIGILTIAYSLFRFRNRERITTI